MNNLQKKEQQIIRLVKTYQNKPYRCIKFDLKSAKKDIINRFGKNEMTTLKVIKNNINDILEYKKNQLF